MPSEVKDAPGRAYSLSWVTQGFSRASDETREKIAPFFFARERNRAWRSSVVRHGKVQDKVEAAQPPRSCVACRSVQDGLEDIRVCACVGERENKLPVVRIEIEKCLIVFNVAVTESVRNRSALYITLGSNLHVKGLRFGEIGKSIPLTRHFTPAAPVQLTTSRRNGTIRRFGISTTRKRLAPSIRSRNQPKGKRI